MEFQPALTNKLKPAIQIVPLADTTFNYSKSNIAWIEGTMAGTLVLARDWKEWSQPGVTTYSSEQTFYNQLTQLIQTFTSQTNAQELLDASAQAIRDNYFLTSTNMARLEILESLV
jgi:hypothetical protein